MLSGRGRFVENCAHSLRCDGSVRAAVVLLHWIVGTRSCGAIQRTKHRARCADRPATEPRQCAERLAKRYRDELAFAKHRGLTVRAYFARD